MAASLVLLTGAGCGDVVKGRVGGRGLDVSDSAAGIYDRSGAFGRSTGVYVTMADYDNVCDFEKAQSMKAHGTVLTVGVVKDSGSPGPVTKGTYYVQTASNAAQEVSGVAYAHFAVRDANCEEILEPAKSFAADGSVTLSEVTSSTIKGSFKLTFEGGDTLSGSFDSPVCGVSNPLTTLPEPVAEGACEK